LSEDEMRERLDQAADLHARMEAKRSDLLALARRNSQRQAEQQEAGR
jgi:hypothetical protein